MRSAIAVRAVALAGLLLTSDPLSAGSSEDSRCEMRFSYSSFVLGRLTAVSYQVTLEGGYSDYTGFTPMSGVVVCRQQRFILKGDEAHHLFDVVATSEIFSLQERPIFERGIDKRIFGEGASATLDYRGLHIEVTRPRVSRSAPFHVIRTEIEQMLKGKAAEPGATDNPGDAQ